MLSACERCFSHRCVRDLISMSCLHDELTSLALVSPGAATDSVTPIFSLKKLMTFFDHRYSDLFSCRLNTTPMSLPSSDIVLSSILCKFSHFFHSGVTPWMVSPRTVHSP